MDHGVEAAVTEPADALRLISWTVRFSKLPKKRIILRFLCVKNFVKLTATKKNSANLIDKCTAFA